MINAILFPSSFFNRKLVDEDLQREYSAAVECGLYSDIFIFSYEEWFHNGGLVLDHAPEHVINAAYRGWMMLPEQYERFYNHLMERNIQLITTPEEYSALHIFPNVYPKIFADTPRTIIFPPNAGIDLPQVKKTFDRFMVKDYVKSVKGTDFPEYFDADISQEQFDNWIRRFVDYRGHLFTGGFCVKEYIDLAKYGECKNEYRVFYMNHQIATINRNSGQPDFAPQPPIDFVEKYRNLDSRFYTIDFAERADGTWTIIEAGDGSVSGLSDYQNYTEFFRKLYYCFA